MIRDGPLYASQLGRAGGGCGADVIPRRPIRDSGSRVQPDAAVFTHGVRQTVRYMYVCTSVKHQVLSQDLNNPMRQ